MSTVQHTWHFRFFPSPASSPAGEKEKRTFLEHSAGGGSFHPLSGLEPCRFERCPASQDARSVRAGSEALRIAGMGLIFLIAFFLTSQARAMEYSLIDLYQTALKSSELIRSADEEITYSELERKRALSVLLPRLSAFASYQQYSKDQYGTTRITIPQYGIDHSCDVLIQPESAHVWGLRADQTVSLSLRELTALRMAGDDIHRSRYDLRALKETYLLQVARGYYSVLMARKGLEIAQSNLERVSKYREAANARLKVGEITRTVLLRAESELSGARSDVVRAQNALALANTALARLVGIETGFTLKEETSDDAEVAPLDELKDTAFSERAELRSLEYRMKMARKQVSYARGAYWPYLSVAGVYQKADEDPDITSLAEDSAYGAVSLHFPFYEGGLRRAEVQQAKVRERQAALQYEDRKKTIALEVERAYLDLMTQKGTLRFLEDQVAFARDNYRGVSGLFALGMANNIDVIDANTLLVSSERQLAEAMYSYRLSILTVRHATGTFLKGIKGNREIRAFSEGGEE